MPPWTIRARESAHYVTLTRGRQGRLRASILALACALVASFCAVGPASALDPPLGRALEEIGAPLGRFGDGPLWALLHGAALEASEADVSLAALPDPEVRLAAGPITAGDIARVFPSDDSLEVVVLTGRELRETLERAAHGLATYDYQDRRPLAGPDFAGPRFVAAAGVSYEIDLTRPAGDRIVHLSWRGTPLAPEQRLRVVLDQSLRGAGSAYAALQAAPRAPDAARALRDVLADYVRRHGVLTAAFQRGWTLLPDYASTPERPLIDRLVRLGAAPPAEVQRLAPDQVARRGDFAYWLARAYGWRETRLSGAYPDVPDSLEPWVDGLLKRKVLGATRSAELFQPFAAVSRATVEDWCTAAARAAGYDLSPSDAAFRRSLATGVRLDPPRAGSTSGDTLRVAQLLGLISNARFPAVRVLATTDFHGAMLPAARGADTLGGSAVLAAYLRRLQAENPAGTVLLDAGDLFQGTMISNLAFGRPVVEQMNALGYSAWAIGNHEFDWGPDTLERRVRELRGAALGANLRERSTGRRPSWARADTVVRRRGVRIAVLGLCNPKTPTLTLARNVASFTFDDDSATAATVAGALRRGNQADVVIGLAHAPATMDSTGRVSGDLARLAHVAGVDLWLGGHSHTRVAGEVAGTPVLIPGARGEAVAVCDLVVDPVRHRVVERSARLEITWANRVIPDSAMAALVERARASVAARAAEPVGRSSRRLSRSRTGESTLGDLVTDVLRRTTGTDVALQNNGALRADMPAGPISRGMVYDALPFENTLVTLELTGAEVRQAIEDGLRTERITQVSGIGYVFDLGAPAGARVRSIVDLDGAPLDSARTYRVVCNDFMAGGGDGYTTLARGRNARDTGLSLRDCVEAAIREASRNGALDVSAEGRVSRAPGSPPPERGEE
ncbi:MAG: hypothetical protein E6K78_01670 [Candidatus Eisenbacteria bacterium]|uniref:5'-Nucleotidase C-terminal domain-containing protein n=1 Tax=Eiseniibacteriota bacterium TaxID=2212470 RepID=A0A538TXI7_UNCEI|nr:MAG: hypothetical protein E6K78_01670 [Candidatus Eisenbacteria bacterium]